MSALPVTFANLPTGEQPLSLFDQNFLYLLNLIQSGGTGFEPVIETGILIDVVGGTRAVALNQPSQQVATTINLPLLSTQSSLGLIISDWAGYGGTITLIPNALDIGGIMGLAQWQLASGGPGLGSSIALYPSTNLAGWYIG